MRKPRRSPPSTQISPNMGRQGLPSGFSCWLPATGAASADLRAAAGGHAATVMPRNRRPSRPWCRRKTGSAPLFDLLRMKLSVGPARSIGEAIFPSAALQHVANHPLAKGSRRNRFPGPHLCD